MTVEGVIEREPEEWLGAMEDFQVQLTKQMLDAGIDDEELVRRWLEGRPVYTAGFGVEESQGAYIDRFWDELHRFFCENGEYEKERNELLDRAQDARTYIVSAVAVAIAPALGVASAVLVPAVATALWVVGKIGLRAWCKSYSTSRAGDEPTLDESTDSEPSSGD